MQSFIEQLQQKNPVLFYFGILMFFGAITTTLLYFTTKTEVLGVNAFLKPTKFFVSVGIFCWTMAFYMQHLQAQNQVTIYNWVLVITLGFEMFAITMQAAKGKMSHFNISSATDGLIFTLMGIMITIAMLWTAFIGYLFFAQKEFAADMNLIWGIRLGIVISVIFAFEGGVMAAMLRHTVGNIDGGPGLPVVNWSKQHGDLRVAHFLGLHALQIIPITAVVVAKNVQQVVIMAVVYFIIISLTLIQAFLGKPFIRL